MTSTYYPILLYNHKKTPYSSYYQSNTFTNWLKAVVWLMDIQTDTSSGTVTRIARNTHHFKTAPFVNCRVVLTLESAPLLGRYLSRLKASLSMDRHGEGNGYLLWTTHSLGVSCTLHCSLAGGTLSNEARPNHPGRSPTSTHKYHSKSIPSWYEPSFWPISYKTTFCTSIHVHISIVH